MTAFAVVDAILITCALAIAAKAVTDVAKGFVRWLKRCRREDNAQVLEALSFSRRHEHLMPLFRGLTEELGVLYIEVTRTPKGLDVRIAVTWWCLWMWWERKRLLKKARVLLREGGVY